MLSLIVTILFALAIAYFAIQNTLGVTLVLANNIVTGVPLYFIVIGSVLTGVILASIISGLNAFSAYRKLRGKEQIIQEDRKQIHDMQEKIMTLEAENTQLRTENERRTEEVRTVDHDEEPNHRPSFFHNLFHPRTESR
jgi:uncharacterized integral membrane protein